MTDCAVAWAEMKMIASKCFLREGQLVFTYRNMSPCDTRGADTERRRRRRRGHTTSWHPDSSLLTLCTRQGETSNTTQILQHSDTLHPEQPIAVTVLGNCLLWKQWSYFVLLADGELSREFQMMPSRLVLAVLCVLPWCFDQIWFLFSVFLSPRQRR